MHDMHASSHSPASPAVDPVDRVDPGTRPKIFAVIILYKMKAEDSPAYRGLSLAMQSDRHFADSIEYMLCDNSPYAQLAPPGFHGTYINDLQNVGLAPRYNSAIQEAEQRGCAWLLLLDQDTFPTQSYLTELVALAHECNARPDVVAVVPKLLQRGRVLSPQYPQALQWGHPAQIGSNAYGVSIRRLQGFNSGAMLKVSALRHIGGFPPHFWLDYLDHATFYLLQTQVGHVFIMHSILEHDLSTNPADQTRATDVSFREGNIFKASRDYFLRYGTFLERAHFCYQFMMVLAGAFRRGEFVRFRAFLRLLVEH
jgi:hypothetical protein